MKLSWSLTVLILAIGAYFYKQTEGTQQATQTSLTALQRSIAELGLDPAAAAEGRAVVHPNDQKRVEETALSMETKYHEEDIHQFARELIDFALEMKRIEDSGEQPPPETKQRLLAFVARLAECDEADMRIILGEAKANKALDDKNRKNLISGCCMVLSQNNPAASVKLLGEARELFGENKGAMLTDALTRWATKDPLSAFAWAERPENVGLVSPSARRGMIVSLAISDPQKAVALALTQGAETRNCLSTIAKTAPMASWKSLLEQLGNDQTNEPNTGPSTREIMLRGIADKLAEGSVETATQWLTTANLSETDRRGFINALSSVRMESKQRVPWLEWIAKNETDPVIVTKYTRNVVSTWTREDFNGTGEWINQQPPGVMREAATQSFAETLAPHEPEAAAVWALNLPATEGRLKLLQRIRDSWKTKDPVASNVFATEHGLQ